MPSLVSAELLSDDETARNYWLKKKAILCGKGKSSRYFLREEATSGLERVVTSFSLCSIHHNTFSYCFQVDYVPRPGWGTRATTLRLVGERIIIIMMKAGKSWKVDLIRHLLCMVSMKKKKCLELWFSSHVCALEDAARKLRWIAMFGAKFLFKWSVYSFLRENLSLT